MHRSLEEHLAWAQDAIELAQQSGQAAFTGRPSPHWFDLDHFRVLLRAAVGNISVRQFLAELDGCTGSRAQTRIAAQFLRRPAASLDATEAAELLTAAQAATKPPKPAALRPLGRKAVVTAGYAIAEGTFTEGEHAPQADDPVPGRVLGRRRSSRTNKKTGDQHALHEPDAGDRAVHRQRVAWAPRPVDQRHRVPCAGSRRAALQRHSQHHVADVPPDQRRQDAGLPSVPQRR